MNKIYQLSFRRQGFGGQATTNHQLIFGKVIKGEGYGRKLGFPTANIDRRQYVKDKLRVKLGIWAGEAKYQISNIKYQIYKAAIVIGPIDSRGLPKLEAHLIGFKGNLYGKKITIKLKNYIRPFKKFKSEAELVKQIKKDVEKVKK